MTRVCDKCLKRKVTREVWIDDIDEDGEKDYELCERCSRRLIQWLEKPETLFEQLFKLE